MKQSYDLVLIPNQKTLAQAVFESAEADEQFRRAFFEGVKDSLIKCDEARQRSEEKARQQVCRRIV